MVLDIGRELVAHLCGNERVCDALLVEIVIQVGQVETDVLADDVDTSTASKGRVEVHHASIEAITGVSGYLVVGSQAIIPLVPMAESHKVAML